MPQNATCCDSVLPQCTHIVQPSPCPNQIHGGASGGISNKLLCASCKRMVFAPVKNVHVRLENADMRACCVSKRKHLIRCVHVCSDGKVCALGGHDLKASCSDRVLGQLGSLFVRQAERWAGQYRGQCGTSSAQGPVWHAQISTRQHASARRTVVIAGAVVSGTHRVGRVAAAAAAGAGSFVWFPAIKARTASAVASVTRLCFCSTSSIADSLNAACRRSPLAARCCSPPCSRSISTTTSRTTSCSFCSGSRVSSTDAPLVTRSSTTKQVCPGE
jgi:hypothetical protein